MCIRDRFKFINKSKLVLRQNWVNIEKPKKSFVNRSKNKILSIGRLEKQKNYINLVQALKNSSLELDIVGDGSLKEEILADGSSRTFLKLPPSLAPIKIAILPLIKKDGLPEIATVSYTHLTLPTKRIV